MRPSFPARLVNGPFDDPALFIPFAHDHKAILFDLGDIGALAARDLLKVDYVCVTHTHMDHFIGFDRLLRLLLGRRKRLHLYGPRGFLKNVEGKLAAYRWNLVRNYSDALELTATEIDETRRRTRTYLCRDGFSTSAPVHKRPFDGRLIVSPQFVVDCAILDHEIPCLGLTLTEAFHVNIVRAELDVLGLSPGPWLTAFKSALYRQLPDDHTIEAATADGAPPTRSFCLGELRDRIAKQSAGQKIAYVTDTVYQPRNVEKIVALIAGADHLFIEAAFLEKDHRIALAKHHLTARQAGAIAAAAAVKRMTVFHFSPRYTDQGHLLQSEAEAEFGRG